VRSYGLSGAFLGTDLAREVYVKLPEEAGKYAGKIVRCEGIVRIDHFFPGFRESAVGGDTRFRGKRWQVQALRSRYDMWIKQSRVKE
jgi:hypothetical protein